MKYLAGLLIFFFSYSVYADIYQVVDAKGNITYSDIPSQNAEKIATTSMNVTETPVTLPSIKQVTKTLPSVAKKPYLIFTIASPADQATLQNQESISIILKIEPNLQVGDMIQGYVDGAPTGPISTTNHINLGRITRGTHQVYAILMDDKKNILKQSNTITIFVHNASAVFPPNKPPTT